jgi:hypothetical protein
LYGGYAPHKPLTRYVLGFGIAGAVISFIIVGFLFGALW